jgi:hypothetical protein
LATDTAQNGTAPKSDQAAPVVVASTSPFMGGVARLRGRLRVQHDQRRSLLVRVQPINAAGQAVGTVLQCGPVPANEWTSFQWMLTVPMGTTAVALRVLGSTGPVQLQRVTLRRESRLARLGRVASRAVGLLLKSPGGLLADVERLLGKKAVSANAPAGALAPDGIPQCRPLACRVTAQPPAVNVLVPSLRREHLSGGPNTALNLAVRLAARGIPVRFLSTDWPAEADTAWLDQHVCELAGLSEVPGTIVWANAHDAGRPVDVGYRDVFLATAWWTAQQVRPTLLAAPQARLWYLIQDFEPGLYAWSTQAALAAETYTWPALSIFCGHLLRDHFRQQQVGPFAVSAEGRSSEASPLVFEPALDRRLFHPQPREANRPRRLVFYARPSAPRNLYELGLVALRRAVDRGAFRSGWELWFIGESISPIDLGQGVTIRPAPWMDYAGYAEFLRGTDLGLSLMLSPHPSYPPLELAACGAEVVTNSFGVKTAERLRELAPRLRVALPEIDAVTTELLAAAAAIEQRISTSGDALPLPQASQLTGLVPSDWETAFAPVLVALWADWQQHTGTSVAARAA